MNDEKYKKTKGFHFEKMLEPDKDYAMEVAWKYSPEIGDLRLAFRDGFLEAQRQLKDCYELTHPQAEINNRIDDLIENLEKLKR